MDTGDERKRQKIELDDTVIEEQSCNLKVIHTYTTFPLYPTYIFKIFGLM